MDDLRDLPIDKLVEPWILLRPVDRYSIDYMELKDSISANGFINSIAARPCKRRPGFFEIIDGMYRLTCAKELDLETIPVIIKYDVTDEDVISLQLQANAIRPETKPCEFARQLRRLQDVHPGASLASIAMLISKSPNWITQQLDLLWLSAVQQKMVDRGEICLHNAYMLAKIPPSLRKDFIDRAKTMTVREFKVLAAGVVKQFKEAVRQGKLDAFFTDDFEPQAYLRSLKAIQEESLSQLEGPITVVSEGCKSPLDGWNAAIQWFMHLDRKSVEDQEKAARAKAREKWTS
jgi:ParB/RepB/Spo0J family partition protein